MVWKKEGVRGVQGVQEFRSSGVQEFRSSGVQEFRSSGVQGGRITQTQAKSFCDRDLRSSAFWLLPPELLELLELLNSYTA